jgi:CheY-like chemotaxis protein
VVICDLGLPEPLIGYRVAEVIHSRDDDERPFLIAFSGYGRAADVERCRRAGFDVHILKPASPSVVAGRVQEGLERRSHANR